MIIVDLDNCVADDAWRHDLIEWSNRDVTARFHRYHCASIWDNAWNTSLFAHRGGIAIFTSRPEMYRSLTEYWLKKRGLRPDRMLMRRDGDDRPSPLVKEEQLNRLLSSGVRLIDITQAYDDRADVIEVYRRHGIPASILAIHSTVLPEGAPAT